jgi:hypothetical protein
MAQTRRLGKHNEKAYPLSAPRPPSQASARPSLEVMDARQRVRDVGLAESGFRATVLGKIMPTDPFALSPCRLASLG